MDAVIYARMEHYEPTTDARDARIRLCQRWAKQNRYHVVRVFTDDRSLGSSLDRPGFTKMCEFVLERKHCDIIIAEHSQLLNKCRDCEMVADFFDELGVRIFSVVDGVITPHRLLYPPMRQNAHKRLIRSGEASA